MNSDLVSSLKLVHVGVADIPDTDQDLTVDRERGVRAIVSPQELAAAAKDFSQMIGTRHRVVIIAANLQHRWVFSIKVGQRNVLQRRHLVFVSQGTEAALGETFGITPVLKAWTKSNIMYAASFVAHIDDPEGLPKRTTFVELCQNMLKANSEYATARMPADANEQLQKQEILCNSYGLAKAAARAKWSYAHYRWMIDGYAFKDDDENPKYYQDVLVLDKQQYANFR